MHPCSRCTELLPCWVAEARPAPHTHSIRHAPRQAPQSTYTVHPALPVQFLPTAPLLALPATTDKCSLPLIQPTSMLKGLSDGLLSSLGLEFKALAEGLSSNSPLRPPSSTPAPPALAPSRLRPGPCCRWRRRRFHTRNSPRPAAPAATTATGTATAATGKPLPPLLFPLPLPLLPLLVLPPRPPGGLPGSPAPVAEALSALGAAAVSMPWVEGRVLLLPLGSKLGPRGK